MIIKYPLPENISALTDLWAQAFGDTEEFISGFFRTGFSPDRCLLVQEQDQLLAALYWFDCLWNGKKIAYLYAIATDKNHRGKGICTALMQETHQLLKEYGYHGATLVPADDGLEKMYRKMGYMPYTEQGTQNINGPVQKNPVSVAEYRTLQKILLPKDAVIHTDAAFSYLQTFAKFYKTADGICCETSEKVQECLPGQPRETALYLPLTQDKTLPSYFALSMA